MEFINRIIEYFSTYDVGNLAQDIISFLATFFLSLLSSDTPRNITEDGIPE